MVYISEMRRAPPNDSEQDSEPDNGEFTSPADIGTAEPDPLAAPSSPISSQPRVERRDYPDDVAGPHEPAAALEPFFPVHRHAAQ